MSKRVRCEKHGLLYDRYGDERCQGCRADALEEQLSKAKEQLEHLTGGLFVALGMMYPLNRIVEPILRGMHFQSIASFEAEASGLKRVIIPPVKEHVDWYWKVPESVAAEIAKVREEIVDKLKDVRESVYRAVCQEAGDLLTAKLSDFVDKKVFTKELKKAVFKGEP